MARDHATRFLNIKSRVEFLKTINGKYSYPDIKGKVLTETEMWAYAICEEMDRLEAKIKKGR